MKLTDEQNAIIESSGNIKVHAVAGSGKTSTLVRYGARRKKQNILYLAFNRSVKAEAQRRFSEKKLFNIKIDTAHSLAYRNIVVREKYEVRQTYKNGEIAEILALGSVGRDSLSKLILAHHIARFALYFCNSSAKKVQELDYIGTVSDSQAKAFAQKYHDHIISGTRLLLAKMNKGEIPVFHDFYLKKFQLESPDLGFDSILFDEGQDASPVMLNILLGQKKATKVIVGDIHQQIYSWRYAVNALANVDFSDYSLTTSFRFPQHIADCAMDCLHWKNRFTDYTPVKIIGAATRSKTSIKATLARTNIALLRSVINFISKDSRSKKIYFEGNFSSYTASGSGSLYDVLNLFNGSTSYIRDPEIAKMKDFTTLSEFAEKSGDTELSMMIGLVEEHGSDLPYYIKKIKDMHIDDEKRDSAQMIFSTVHKCKGMEYDSIFLEDDFIDSTKIEKLSLRKDLSDAEIGKINEEINLRYVAITRTRNKIQFAEDTKSNKNTPPKTSNAYNQKVAQSKKSTVSSRKKSTAGKAKRKVTTQESEYRIKNSGEKTLRNNFF